MSFGGTLAQCFAEVYSGLTLHQATAVGAPFIVGAMPSTIDMRTTIGTYGAPELHMLVAAASLINKKKTGLPFYGTGGCGDSKLLDYQAVVEATVGLMSSALSSPHIVHDLGFLDHSNIISPEMIVLCDEIIASQMKMLASRA